MLVQVRSRYWIIDGRQEVKNWDQEWKSCERRRAKPAAQIMAPLPTSRLGMPMRAFAKSCVDYAGPFVTKITRRVSAKRYLCLFTCPATTVPLKCKLPPSRETRLVSLETCLVSLETSLVSLEKFLVSLECTASTNALPLGECTNGIIRSNGRTHGKRTDNKWLDKPFETTAERMQHFFERLSRTGEQMKFFSNGKVERVNGCNIFRTVKSNG